MTCASKILEDYIPDSDATIVTRILDEGGDVNAILNLDNFAFSGAGDTSAFGPTLNPHDTGHLAGGSSGGSAAALYYDDIDITIGGRPGRLHPHSCLLLRRGGPQTDPRPCSLHRHRGYRQYLRPRRTHGPDSLRCSADA